MGSRMAGSVLLRHAVPRLFAATATSPAVAAARPLLAPVDGFPAAMMRLMSTSSAAVSEAKKGAAKGKGEKKEVVINSYWGIDQSNKLVREDGTEWKWTCFRVRPYETLFVRILISAQFCRCGSSLRRMYLQAGSCDSYCAAMGDVHRGHVD
jgi:ubiquinol oxidase